MLNHQKIEETTNKELEKLRRKRINWVQSSKENRFVFDSLLSGLYNEPSHFVYEILQNAEDAVAKKIRFELFEDRLDIYHDGIDFNFKDIDGVTGIAIPKERDLNAIGIFGVGFKSVFAVTKTPYIFSGRYKIKIEDFVVPSIVSNIDQFDSSIVKETLIRLPFNHNKRSAKESFNLISEKLKNIGLKTLLFLKNIEAIQWQTLSSNGNYSKSSKYYHEIKNTKKVIVKSSAIAEEYIVIEKPINIGSKKLKVEVAYRLDKDKKSKRIIVQEPNSKLVVFFPTAKDTYLNFTIQGPYKTTPSRENIPLDDEQNKAIIEETGNLVAESLSIIKDLGYLDVNFLNILPIESKYINEQIYPIIYQKVKEKLLSGKLLPTFDSKHTKAENSLLARGKELTEFLDTKDIQKLFSKRNWLSPDITKDKTPELREYLINELKVEEVDFEIFAGKIDAEFLQTKTDKWLINFYKRLLGQEALWNNTNYPPGILRTKPIIRLETGEHIAPFNDRGETQVYLPTETKSKYKTVKRIFSVDKSSLKFLKALGITEPSLFAQIKEDILPKYKAENPTKDEWYMEDFRKLLEVCITIQSDKKDEFIEKLSEAYFVDSVNNITGKHYLRKPSEVYFKNEDLKEYFDGYNSVYFVSNELYKKFGKEKLESFLKELGAKDKPRRIEIVGNLSEEEKQGIKNGNCSRYGGYNEGIVDYEYEGLENFINEITIEKSFLLWKLLLKNVEQEGQIFFKGEYRWFYHVQHSGYFDAKFLKILKTQAWLVDKDEVFKKPCEIALSELSDNYHKKNSNVDILRDVLELKSEIVDLLSEEERQWLKLKDEGCSIEHIKELIVKDRREPQSKEENEVSVWVPECEPDEFEIPIEEASLSKIFTPDLKNQEPKTEIDESNLVKVDEITEENITEGTVSAQNKKKIGEQGEKTVYSSLKKGYKKDVFINIEETSNGFKARNGNGEIYEVIWFNKHRESGKGYDLKIKKDGVEIEYIEVKSKVGTEAEFVLVSGTQWEFARSLFDRKEGDKYSFYVVTNTGKPDAKIHSLINPIKLWKDGKLYAHPVNIKL